MGFLLLVKNVFLYVTVLFVLALVTPLRRRVGWKTSLILLLLGLSLGVTSARAGLDDWMISHVKQYREHPTSDIPARYVLGDFIPTKKLLGGGLPKEVQDFLTETASSENRCLRAMAQDCLGQKVNVNIECAEPPTPIPVSPSK